MFWPFRELASTRRMPQLMSVSASKKLSLALLESRRANVFWVPPSQVQGHQKTGAAVGGGFGLECAHYCSSLH